MTGQTKQVYLKLPEGREALLTVPADWEEEQIRARAEKEGLIQPEGKGLLATAVDSIKDIPKDFPTTTDVAQQVAVSSLVRAPLEMGRSVLDWGIGAVTGLGGIITGTDTSKSTEATQKLAKRAWYDKVEAELPKAETRAGEVAGGLAKFVAGFVPVYKALQSAQKAGKLGTSLRMYASGAIADYSLFAPEDKRLADLAIKYDSPVLNNAVTQYLSSKETDTVADSHLKNVVEGALTGGLIDLGLKAGGALTKEVFLKKFMEKAKAAKKVLTSTKPSKWTSDAAEFVGNDIKGLEVPQELMKKTEGVDRDAVRTHKLNYMLDRKRDYDDITEQAYDAFNRQRAAQAQKGFDEADRIKEAQIEGSFTAYDKAAIKSKRLEDTIKAESTQMKLDALVEQGVVRKLPGNNKPIYAPVGRIRELKKEGITGRDLEEQVIKDREIEAAWANKEIDEFEDKMADLLHTRSKTSLGQRMRKQRGSVDYGALFGSAKNIYKASTSLQEFTEALVKEQGPMVRALAPGLYDWARVEHAQGPIIKTIPDEKWAGSINLNRLDTEDEIKASIYAAAGQKPKTVQSHKEVQELADLMGLGLKDAQRLNHTLANATIEAKSIRDSLVSSTNQILAIVPKMKGASDEELATFYNLLNKHVALMDAVEGISTNSGRLLNQFNIAAKADDKSEAFRNFIDKVGGRDRIELIADALIRLDNPANINDFLNKVLRKPTVSDAFIEYYMNSLLSGLTTQTTNLVSTLGHILYTIPETYVAAGISKLRGSNSTTFRQANAYAAGFAQAGKDALIAMGKSFKADDSLIKYGDTFIQDVQGKLELRRHRAIRAETFGLEEGKGIGKAVDVLGTVIRTPGRALFATDAGMKTLTFRMEIARLAQARAEQLVASGKLDPSAIDTYKNGILKDPPIAMKNAAMEKARYTTFTKQLGDNGRAFQHATSHPLARIFLPFIRTPINILKAAGERTVLAPLSKAVREEYRKGGAARDMVLAKMITASSISLYVFDLARQGIITGSAPADPGERANFYAQKKQPYSVKDVLGITGVKDRYISLSRMEPASILFGTTADAAAIWDKISSGDRDKLASLIAASVTNNLLNKTYMSGVSDLAMAFHDPERYGDRYFNRLISSMAVPNIATQVSRTEDPYLREARTLIDELKRRTGIGRDKLQKRLNIWGMPIKLEGGLGPDILSNMYVSTEDKTKLFRDMADNKITVRMPPRKMRGVELTDDQYWKFVQTRGQFALSILKPFAETSRWDRMSAYKKSVTVKRVFRKASRLAWRQLLPSIKDKVKEAERQKRAR